MITSASELEAILDQSLIRIDKFLYERGEIPKVDSARRTLERVRSEARDSAKLKSLRAAFSEAAEVLRAEIARDEDLRNDLWDVLDYIDYRC